MTCCTLQAKQISDCALLTVEPSCGDIRLPYGTDNELVAILQDGDGRAIAITTDTVTMTVTDGRGGSTVFSKSNAPGAHSDPDQGETVFAILAADIIAADPHTTTTWLFEIRRTDNGGLSYSHLAGRFIVEPTI